MILLLILDFSALILYDLRAFSFCRSILDISPNHKLAKPLSLLVNCLLMAAIFLLRLPMPLNFLTVYLAILLQLCMMFRGKALVFYSGAVPSSFI